MVRYNFDDQAEREPLDNPHNSPYSQQQQDSFSLSRPDERGRNAPTGPPRNHPGAHPDSAFNRAQQNSRGAPPSRGAGGAPYNSQAVPLNTNSTITPGADNFSESAAGGLAGIANTVAERNPRESDMDTMRGSGSQRPPPYQEPYMTQPPQTYQGQYSSHASSPAFSAQGFQPPYRPHAMNRDSDHSLVPLGAAATAPGIATPGSRRSPHSTNTELYSDDPYQGYSTYQNPHLGMVNPNDIEDDGDEGLDYRRPARTSLLSLGNGSDRTNNASASAAGGAAAGGALGSLMGRGGGSNRNSQYDPVNNISRGGSGGSGGVGGVGGGELEKTERLNQEKKKKRRRWAIIIVFIIVIAGAIVGGVVGGLLTGQKRGASGTSKGQSAADDTDKNGDLNKNSQEIKDLMNNKNLHKVFPGIDYTPLNTQYPDCHKWPPSQNNITRDLAVLSQLSNTVRLYGTDCNQTQMLIHSVKQLELQDTVKIWLGVWQDGNDTTNARQLSQMWDILKEYGDKYFKGIIVANEILFREEMTLNQLSTLLDDVRKNLTTMGLDLPVATSDLGDNWDASLAKQSDYIMSNVHPFFAGKNAKDAAGWTWSFFTDHDSAFSKSDKAKNVIAETGWPTAGGTDCGTDSKTNCPNAAVAGVDELNTFMENWVCEALSNGTEYFWFEAFDEPWKIQFNEKGKEWEDKWGLMDVNRKLKDGVKIPDCGGKTV